GPQADKARLRAWQKLGAVLIECAADKNNLDLKDVAQRLAQKGLTRVFCEGGGALAAALLNADLVDELIGVTAGRARPAGDWRFAHQSLERGKALRCA
ncbi:MAG: dihydrofolate reductase family protein, partial [Paracoccaceae bacterium]